MRIIEALEIQLACSQCKNVLGVSPDDVKVEPVISYGRGFYDYYCNCCACNNKIRIRRDNIPQAFLSKVNT